MLAYLKERKVSKSLVFPFVCKGDMEDLLQVGTWGLVAIRNLNLRQRVKIFSLVLARKKLLLQPLTYMFNPPPKGLETNFVYCQLMDYRVCTVRCLVLVKFPCPKIIIARFGLE